MRFSRPCVSTYRRHPARLRDRQQKCATYRRKSCASTSISRKLIERVAYGTDIELLREEEGSLQVYMPIDAILIIGVRVCEIIGQARHGRKFKAGGGIEIGITESVVPGGVPIP